MDSITMVTATQSIHRIVMLVDLKKKIHPTEYLIELNLTGTLPDEMDKVSTVSEYQPSIFLVKFPNAFIPKRYCNFD